MLVSRILAGILTFAARRASVRALRAVPGHLLAGIAKSAIGVFAVTIPVFRLFARRRMP